MKESIYMHIPLVILPTDEFTGKIIKNPDFEVWAEGAGRPVRKPEGFWVFTETFGEEVCVGMRGYGYREMRVSVSLPALKRQNPVVKIIVKPDRNYSFPAGTVYMEGTLPKHSVLLAAGKSHSHAEKLRADCNEGDEILAVYQEVPRDIGDMTCLLADRKEESGNEDWVRLLAPLDFERGIYPLQEPVRCFHGRAKTRLFPAVRHETDLHGTDYFLAIPSERGMEQVSVHGFLKKDGCRQKFAFRIKTGETWHQDF